MTRPTGEDEMNDMTDERAAEVLAAMRQDGGTVDDADWIAAIDHAVSRLRSQPPAEAQPCGCGEATCTVPWEPGCGLGKSEQHAEAQAQGGWYRYNKPAPRWEDTKFGKWLDPAVYGPPREQHGYSLEVAPLAQQPAAVDGAMDEYSRGYKAGHADATEYCVRLAQGARNA